MPAENQNQPPIPKNPSLESPAPQPESNQEGRDVRMMLALRSADKMAWICDDWVKRRVIDARSALADARLSYGEPFKYSWSKLEAPSVPDATAANSPPGNPKSAPAPPTEDVTGEEWTTTDYKHSFIHLLDANGTLLFDGFHDEESANIVKFAHNSSVSRLQEQLRVTNELQESQARLSEAFLARAESAEFEVEKWRERASIPSGGSSSVSSVTPSEKWTARADAQGYEVDLFHGSTFIDTALTTSDARSILAALNESERKQAFVCDEHKGTAQQLDKTCAICLLRDLNVSERKQGLLRDALRTLLFQADDVHHYSSWMGMIEYFDVLDARDIARAALASSQQQAVSYEGDVA